MALVRNIAVNSGGALQTTLNYDAPLDFNNTTDELIITRTTSYFPVELFNDQFPTKATDNRPLEVVRTQTIVGTDTGTIGVGGAVISDSTASFPTTPSLTGRLLRDSASQVFKILSNTSNTITVELNNNSLTNGKYIILPDFTNTTRIQDNFEFDLRTTVEEGVVNNLVVIQNNTTVIKQFEQDEVANLIFVDGNGTRFLIKSNTATSITLFENEIPVLGPGMAILGSHVNTNPIPYTDTFLNEAEISNRTGTGLQPNTFYYYTVFTKPENTNVAQAEYGSIDSGVSTQGYSISADAKGFGNRLYNYWPSIFRQLDITEDLKDLMDVFGFFFDELHALVDTYRLQDTDNVLVTGVLPLSEQFGLPQVGYTIGADTLRRIAKDMLSCWKLKGSKEGIAVFIRKITTWDITNGSGDYSGAIQDSIPNTSALRFFDTNLGSANTRLTQSDPFIAGGRFASGLPGIVIPGFFTFREFVITLTNVALFVGSSTDYDVSENNTTLTDANANFGAVDSLVGNFLLPNQGEVNDIFRIVGNTATTITVSGIVNNRNIGGSYAILSPLNTNRFVILNRLLPFYIPLKTAAGFQFV